MNVVDPPGSACQSFCRPAVTRTGWYMLTVNITEFGLPLFELTLALLLTSYIDNFLHSPPPLQSERLCPILRAWVQLPRHSVPGLIPSQ